MTRKPKQAVIMVFAGTNGAGKSSVIAQYLSGEDATTYYNPDEHARRLRRATPGLSATDANSQGWERGRALLEDAIRDHTNFNFETTLGANTIPTLLREAAESGLMVHMYYVGLESPEMHIRRVASRVQKGGHSIPEDKIRQRYESSPKNLITLWPALHRVVLFDNSADPHDDGTVEPLRILRMEAGSIVDCFPDEKVPPWAREIVAAARRFDAAVRKRI